MSITTTGIAFFLSAIGLAFCGIRFFEAFQKMGGLRSGNRIGIFLSSLFLGYSFQHAILAIGGLFFSKSSEALYVVLIFDYILIALITALGMYLVFYIILPKISPWPTTVMIFLFGVFVITLLAVEHPLPFVTATASIDWNMSQQLKIWSYLLLLFNIGLPFIVFAKNFSTAKTSEAKNISLIIMIIQLIGIINISILFSDIIKGINNVQGEIFNFLLAVIGIFFIVAFLLMPIFAGWTSRKYRDDF